METEAKLNQAHQDQGFNSEVTLQSLEKTASFLEAGLVESHLSEERSLIHKPWPEWIAAFPQVEAELLALIWPSSAT